MKCCSKCKIEKDDSEFPSRSNICKICRKEWNKQYQQNNAEVLKEKRKQYRQNNAEAIKEQKKQYRQNNAEAIKERRKQYRQNNTEEIKEREKQYREINKQILKEKRQKYKQESNLKKRLKYKEDVNFRERYKKQAREWRHKNPEKSILKDSRRRSVEKNIPFNLSAEDIIIPEVCPILKIPLNKNTGLWKDDSPSIDRIIPEKGYVKENIIIISYRANRIKNDHTISEIVNGNIDYSCDPEDNKKIIEYYKKILEEAKKNE